MSIYLTPNMAVAVQGMTGSEGSFHAREMLAYGTNIVCGVTPGKGGARVLDRPIRDTMAEAVKNDGANASIIFVPAPAAVDAIMEAAGAGIKLIVCVTEGIPIKDMTLAWHYVREKGSILIGPNCPGLISPGLKIKLGIMPNRIFSPGNVGVVSRSGTLTYEVVEQIHKLGLGESTCVGIGGDPVIGQTFTDALQRFNEDPETRLIVMVGEIGGNAEQNAAVYIKDNMKKPTLAFIAGRTAPPGRRMGHAGAIVSGKTDTTKEKMAFLEQCGIKCVDNLAEVGEKVAAMI